MKRLSYILILLCCFSFNCLSQRIVKFSEKGSVTQANFTTSIPFRYENKHIFIDVEINGVSYNFLFDSGADFNIVDLNHIENIDFKKVSKAKISGSSFKKQKIQLIEVSKLSISEIEFNNLGAAIMDLSFINNHYPCSSKPVSGIIGANLLRKLNLQIDYKNQKIIFSDKISNFDLPNELLQFEMVSKSWGSPLVNVNINGIDKRFIIDTGSSGKITTGKEFKESLDLTKDKINYISVTKEDKLKKEYTNLYAQVEHIYIGDLELINQIISLEKGVSSLIGNELFENFIITFDWKNNILFLEKINDPSTEQFFKFELSLKPNYITNKIEISSIYNKESSTKEYKIGTEILAINEINVSNLSKEELCDFWKNEWSIIELNEIVSIEIESKKIELIKTDLLIKY